MSGCYPERDSRLFGKLPIINLMKAEGWQFIVFYFYDVVLFSDCCWIQRIRCTEYLNPLCLRCMMQWYLQKNR